MPRGQRPKLTVILSISWCQDPNGFFTAQLITPRPGVLLQILFSRLMSTQYFACLRAPIQSAMHGLLNAAATPASGFIMLTMAQRRSPCFFRRTHGASLHSKIKNRKSKIEVAVRHGFEP